MLLKVSCIIAIALLVLMSPSIAQLIKNVQSVPVILQEEDTNAMQFSIENRSPYLNSELYKYIINLNEKNFVK